MGAQQSAPVFPPPQARIAVPPQDPAATCRVASVELNQITNDLRNKQIQVDTCNPAEAQARNTKAALAANNAYVVEKTAQFNTAMAEYTKNLDLVKTVGNAVGPLSAYSSDLKMKASQLQEDTKKYEQAERVQRRNFLDNSPQSGVNRWLQTDDDKVLFSFWICYGIGLIGLIAFLLTVFGVSDMKQKMSIGGLALFVGYGLAYYGIVMHG